MSPLQSPWSFRSLVRFEWSLTLIALILSGIGLALIFSATAAMGDVGRTYVLKQAIWCSFGLTLMAVFLFFDYHVFDRYGVWLYVAVIAALIAVWGVGRVTAGSRRWIEIGFMRFQPSEFAKLAVVIILAKYFSNLRGGSDWRFLDMVKAGLLVALPFALVVVQPDLGTAGVIVLIAASMILFAGMGRKALMWTGGIIIALIPVLFFVGDFVLREYQKKRLLTFWNPEYDPLGAGYHIIQSQIAIGSGGLLGKGFLQGTQNQLLFLPVKHTDFIFAILAEEFGFVGCVALLVLFAALLLRGLAIAGKARDTFGVLLSFGCVAMLFWHVTINVGMALGMLPVVGVPLSFVSYGGSSLLASYMAVAILASVSMRRFLY
ncbi:MAG: rod shape-determining protein RodA [Deltaproteobacteria bacterium]|nr:rod shape-determining protein RodA [Deltaproteobacteria bacterium]